MAKLKTRTTGLVPVNAERLPDDLTFLKDPDSWPNWPFLPIKRRDNSLVRKNLGVLVASEEYAKGHIIVNHVYLFSLPKTTEDWNACPKTEYDSLEALLRDGWIVD